MKNLKEGNLYNYETGEMKKDRSSELDDAKKIMMKQFWESMARQGIDNEKAKQIVKTTFGV